MFGQNPIRQPVMNAGNELEIKRIFPTIQGEGPMSGVPAVFVRLAGCNLQCKFCDTEFEDGATLPIEEIVAQVNAFAVANDNAAHMRKLVVITGGEPLRQPISKLCDLLIRAGYQVQIETNGTLFRPDLPEEVSIVCSPKNPNGKYAPVRPDLLARAHALKFIISAHRDAYKTVEEVGQTEANVPVYVQPMDEYDAAKNAANLELAKNLALKHGYHLSVQLHKIIGVE